LIQGHPISTSFPPKIRLVRWHSMHEEIEPSIESLLILNV